MLAGITGMAVNLITTPIVLHAVGPITFGLWMTLVSSVSYLSLADIGVAASIARFVGNHRAVGSQDQIRPFFGTVAVMYASIFAVVLAGGVLVNVLLPVIVTTPWLRTQGISFAVLGIAASVAFAIWTGGLWSALHASQQLPLANFLRIVTMIATGALLAGAAIAGSGIVGLATATAVGALSTFIVSFIVVRRRMPWIKVGRPSRIQAIRVGSYGGSMFMIFLAGALNFQTDNLVIAATIGVGAVTAYSIALRVTRSIVLLLHKIPDVMFPFYVGSIGRQETNRLQSSFLLTARLELAAASCISAFLALTGPTLVSLWVGPDNVLAPAAFGLALVMLVVEAAIHPAAILSISAGGELKLASVFLAKKLGVTGVILGTVVAHCSFTGWWLPRWALRRANLRLRDYAASVLAPSLAPGVLSVLVGFVVLTALAGWHGSVGVSLAAAAAVGVFVGAYFFLRRSDDLPAAVQLVNSLVIQRLRSMQGSP
jgi:O-antigen/teichoic acid export membrane protein